MSDGIGTVSESEGGQIVALDGSSFLVDGEADIQDLVPLYLAHRSSDLEAAAAALERSDFRVLYAIGHNMHGSGRSFGFDELTAIGCELERAAQAADRAEIAVQLGRLRSFLTRGDITAAARGVSTGTSGVALVADAPHVSGTVEILLVDDQEMNAAIFSRYLAHEGYTVRYLASGDAALAELGRCPPPALIMLDVVMPGTNGLDVCRQIKSNPVTSEIPVMVVTSMDSRDDRIQGWAAGADDVLSKPVRRDELVSRVRSLLGTKKPAGAGLLRAVSPSSEGEGG